MAETVKLIFYEIVDEDDKPLVLNGEKISMCGMCGALVILEDDHARWHQTILHVEIPGVFNG